MASILDMPTVTPIEGRVVRGECGRTGKPELTPEQRAIKRQLAREYYRTHAPKFYDRIAKRISRIDDNIARARIRNANNDMKIDAWLKEKAKLEAIK